MGETDRNADVVDLFEGCMDSEDRHFGEEVRIPIYNHNV